LIVDEYRAVFVELDVATVRAPVFTCRSYDHGLGGITLLYFGARHCIPDGHDDHVAEAAYRRREPPSTLMHCTTFAPELSATSSTDSIWIMSAQLLVGSLYQTHYFPALGTRQRPMLQYLDSIALLALIVFVMRFVGAMKRTYFLYFRFEFQANDFDSDRLVHLVARYDSNETSAAVCGPQLRCALSKSRVASFPTVGYCCTRHGDRSALVQDSINTRKISARLLYQAGVFELIGEILHPIRKEFLLERRSKRSQVFRGSLSEILSFITSLLERVPESLSEVSKTQVECLARHGFGNALNFEHHPAGFNYRYPAFDAALALPIRTSSGFFVMGLSGILGSRAYRRV